MSPKLSPSLRAALERDPAHAGPAALPEQVQIAVKFTGDLEDLTSRAFAPYTVRRHPTEGWAIASGPMPVERVAELEDVPHVVKVEGSRPLQPELDRSVAEIRAKDLHTAPTPLTGAGVVVGVIDGGFDIAHQSLRLPGGKTRILGLWDQAPPPGATGAPPPAFPGVGFAYTRSQIDAHLDGSAPNSVVVRDSDGHGSHVAGIAAGDGSQAGNCRGQFTYVGVAPQADLILVKVNVTTAAIGESVNLQNALDFIWSHPDAANKGVAVNISLGDNLGPHDGTSLVEQAIDLDLAGVSGRAVVKSAGNEGAARHHAAAPLIAGASADLDFEVQAGDTATRELELWYDGATTATVTLLAPAPAGAARPTSPPVAAGAPVQNWAPQAGVNARIESLTADPDNGDNSVHIALSSTGSLPAGGWTLRVTNTGAAPTPVDCWIERGTGSPAFTSNELRARSISIPGTSREVITVGSYAQSGFLFFTWTGDLADSSSRGPTRDERIKPDVSAPGVGITSAKAGAVGGCCCDCCYDFYASMDGTSMAAPHVTGVVALMLQKNRTLTCADLKGHLMASARVPDGLTASDMPTSDWGAGKVDAAAAVGRVPQPGSPGGGPLPEPPLSVVGPAAPGPQASAPALAAELHRAVLRTEAGQRWGALVSRHFSEVRALINADRRVALRWHRLDVPAIAGALAALARAGGPPGAPLPAEAEDARRRAAAFLAILHARASPGLRGDIDRHGAELLRLNLGELARELAGLARAA